MLIKVFKIYFILLNFNIQKIKILLHNLLQLHFNMGGNQQGIGNMGFIGNKDIGNTMLTNNTINRLSSIFAGCLKRKLTD